MGHALPRRIAAALAGAALSTAMLAACSGGEEEAPPTDEPVAEEAPVEDTEDSDDGALETEDDTTDDTTDQDEDGGDDPTGDTNLFEGTWGFGHDSKVLSAEELGDLLESEAESRGPEEMSLDVECGDGVDTGAGDLDAECIAYADEGVEHRWLVTVGPADAGLEVEVENAT